MNLLDLFAKWTKLSFAFVNRAVTRAGRFGLFLVGKGSSGEEEAVTEVNNTTTTEQNNRPATTHQWQTEWVFLAALSCWFHTNAAAGTSLGQKHYHLHHLLIQFVFFSVWWDQLVIGKIMSCYEYEWGFTGFAKHEGNYIYHLSRFSFQLQLEFNLTI